MIAQPHPGVTASGALVWFHDPAQTEVRPGDLCIALGRMGRYAGAIPVTVLDHLALCVGLARLYGYSPEEIAYCAAHDLHEAYVLDLPAALKALLPDYCTIEDAWEAHVHRSVGLAWPLPPKTRDRMKYVDYRARVVEMTTAGHPRACFAADLDGVPMAEPEYLCWLLLPCSPLNRWDLVWDAIQAGVDVGRMPWMP